MAERFLVHDLGAQKTSAATHAIVIGVGDYPHLLSGSKETTPDHGGMGQLTSPPLSARAFASWLIDSFYHPEKPLASVSLLLSERKPSRFVNPRTNDKFPVKLADSDNTHKAVRDWIGRGNLNPDNLLLFFFCGHGLAAGTETSLLLADFGADPMSSLDGALDFRSFRSGMKRCRASEQCFFVDACRTDSELLKEADAAGFSPIQPGPRDGGWPKRKAPVLYSTMQGFKAYAIPDGPSLYTEALLQSLQDLAAEKSTGDWRVNTARLFQAIDHVLSKRVLEARAVAPPTADDAASIDLNLIKTPPKALVYVKTEPPGALGDMSVACAQEGFDTVHVRPETPNKTELLVILPTGSYNFTGTVDGNPAKTASEYVSPISSTVKLK